MFIVNTFFLLFLYSLYLSLHQKHQKKILVCENLLGNKSWFWFCIMSTSTFRTVSILMLLLEYDFDFFAPSDLNTSSITALFYTAIDYWLKLNALFPITTSKQFHNNSAARVKQ